MSKHQKTVSEYPPTPELERLIAVKDKSQSIGEFLDWLRNHKGWNLGEWQDDQFWQVSYGIETLLAEYFKIDLNKVENERRAILDSLRH